MRRAAANRQARCRPADTLERPPVDGYTAPAVPTAFITFHFDPNLHLGDRLIRWETLAIGGSVLVALVLTAIIAGRIRLPQLAHHQASTLRHLRRDDLLLVVLGVVPGAVLGGRLDYVLLHLDYYAANRAAILDPANGGLALSGAVLFGSLTGALVARLFDEPLGYWFNLAAAPLLLVLGLGKAALALGGTGQGLPSTINWATRYLGTGPWGSLGPEIPSHPAQVYEALGVALVLFLVTLAWDGGAFRSGDGRAFPLALGGWAAIRVGAATTWRDLPVWGPLRTEQVVDLGVALLALVVWVVIVRRSRRAALAPRTDEPTLSWPDPDRPPPF